MLFLIPFGVIKVACDADISLLAEKDSVDGFIEEEALESVFKPYDPTVHIWASSHPFPVLTTYAVLGG